MKLSRHARIELLILSGLALGSCDMPQAFRASDADRLDVADVNARNALRRVADLEGRVEELEAKLAQ